MSARNSMRPVHPSGIQIDELDELKPSANTQAKALVGMPAQRAEMILNGQREVSADTALQLARCFGETLQLWLNLLKARELRRAATVTVSVVVERMTPRQSAA